MNKVTIYTFTNLSLQQEYHCKFIVRIDDLSDNNFIMEILNEIFVISDWDRYDQILAEPQNLYFPSIVIQDCNFSIINGIEDEMIIELSNMKI